MAGAPGALGSLVILRSAGSMGCQSSPEVVGRKGRESRTAETRKRIKTRRRGFTLGSSRTRWMAAGKGWGIAIQKEDYPCLESGAPPGWQRPNPPPEASDNNYQEGRSQK